MRRPLVSQLAQQRRRKIDAQRVTQPGESYAGSLYRFQNLDTEKNEVFTMGKFTEQMASLTESVVASRRDCIQTVNGMLSEFGRAQASMAEQQKSSLAAGCKARVKQVDSIRKVNGTLMSEFNVLHQNMSQAQSQNLQSFTLGIRNETGVMLDGFTQAHADMAGSLRERLSADTATIRRDVTELKRGFNEARSELRDDMQAAAQIWKNRNGRGATMPTQASAKAESGSFGARSARPKTEAKSQPSKHGSEMSDEERVLQVVRENPSGISATQIGEQVSLLAMAVGKIMKELIEEGKAQRDDGTRLFTPTKGAR
jgi:hypothetical protein